jgi:hypothetical protein
MDTNVVPLGCAAFWCIVFNALFLNKDILWHVIC